MLRFLRLNRTKSNKPSSIERFRANGYLPWTEGYADYKWKHIGDAINSQDVLTLFQRKQPLPSSFGWRIDERIVEYPWLISQLKQHPKRLLDAGSALNFKPILHHLGELDRDITIMTLEPEHQAFWDMKVSYQYGDLRRTPFRDEWFDEIVSISTLEHIGFDNSLYGVVSESDDGNFAPAVDELWRILRPNGVLYITLPYGRADNIVIDEKTFARQFDAEMLGRLLANLPTKARDIVFFRYTPDGWVLSEQADCDDLQYFNIHQQTKYDSDVAAAARAVCCIKAIKSR